jgi:hypothetical protein
MQPGSDAPDLEGGGVLPVDDRLCRHRQRGPIALAANVREGRSSTDAFEGIDSGTGSRRIPGHITGWDGSPSDGSGRNATATEVTSQRSSDA